MSEQKLSVVDTITTCHCGNTSDNHHFRHLFTPTIEIEICEDENGNRVFRMDATQWKSIKHEGKCSVPQCSAGKPLHGPIIKHEYKPLDVYEYRVVSFTIPEDAPCSSCGIPFSDHKVRHHFGARVILQNKGEHDTVKIKHTSGVPIEVSVN